MVGVSLAVLESRIEAHLRKIAKSRREDPVALIEVVDEAALWDDPFGDLTPSLSGLTFEALMTTYPLLGCAAAAEIGFRFEGVGTVFWARFDELMGSPIPVGRRPLLADAYDRLTSRFPIQRPAASDFNEHFSIIAWPISNALMPSEIAAPLARLLARGPSWSAATSGRRTDLSALRAWALSWEGRRLTEWLQNEAIAGRVIAALLTDNSQGLLTAASFRRVADAYAHQSEAFFALRDAKRRRQADAAKTGSEIDLGALSLRRFDGRFGLTVTWNPLPKSVLEAARTQASGHAWRPRLWGQGSPLHADQALGSLPVLLGLSSIPSPDQLSFPGADQTFGEGSPVAAALRARQVDWEAPMAFLVDPEFDTAERASAPLTRDRGQVWLIDSPGRPLSLPIIGEVAGRAVRSAELADLDTRAMLQASGLWKGVAQAQKIRRLSRHPLDAMTLRKGQVRPGQPYSVYDDASLELSRLARNGRRTLTDVEGASEVAADNSPIEGAPSPPEIFIFERQSAFDALIEERLLLRIESSLGAAEWPLEAMIVCEGEILAFGRQTVRQDGHGLGADGRVLRALQAEPVRKRLLEAGTATLRIRVGNHPWETIALTRADGEVDWELADPSASVSRASSLVAATAPRAHHFEPIDAVTAPAAGATAFAVEMDDGRLASPSMILATDKFDLGDLSTNFSDLNGSRQLVASGTGVLDVARARRAWASATCKSLGAVSARLRVVRQFEGPLVRALCGAEWSRLETADAFDVDLGRELFKAVVALGVIEIPEDFQPADLSHFEQAFAANITKTCPTWPEADLDDEAADRALSEAFEDALNRAHGEDRLLLLDVDDFDFGASSEAWRSASDRAHLAGLSSPLLGLIAPSKGAKVLARRTFIHGDLAETSSFLADWTSAWCLPRSEISKEVACSSLQVWLSPAAADTDVAIRFMARDAFLARAVRYVAMRMAS